MVLEATYFLSKASQFENSLAWTVCPNPKNPLIKSTINRYQLIRISRQRFFIHSSVRENSLLLKSPRPAFGIESYEFSFHYNLTKPHQCPRHLPWHLPGNCPASLA